MRLYFIVGYFLYGAFLIWRDFRASSLTNAPLYVHRPSIGRIVAAFLLRPLHDNGIYLVGRASASGMFFGISKLIIKVVALGYGLRLLLDVALQKTDVTIDAVPGLKT